MSCDLEALSCDSALFWRLEELRVGLIWVGHRESCSSILGGATQNIQGGQEGGNSTLLLISRGGRGRATHGTPRCGLSLMVTPPPPPPPIPFSGLGGGGVLLSWNGHYTSN